MNKIGFLSISFMLACQPYSLQQLYPDVPEIEEEETCVDNSCSTCETVVENVVNLPELQPVINNNIEVPATSVDVSCPTPVVEVEAPVTPVINVPAPVVNVSVAAPESSGTASGGATGGAVDVIHVKVQTNMGLLVPNEGQMYNLGNTSGIIENGIYKQGKECAIAICIAGPGNCRGQYWDRFYWDVTACCPTGYRPVSVMRAGGDDTTGNPNENLVCHRI